MYLLFFKVLLNLSLGGNGQAISPECLFLVIWKVVPRFRGYQQQDAHEFLTYMLDRLHTELLQLLPRLGHEPLGLRGKQSIVTAVFGGTLLSVVHFIFIPKKKTVSQPCMLEINCLIFSSGSLYELSNRLKNSRAISRFITGHSWKTTENEIKGTGGSMQFNMQPITFLQGRGTCWQWALLLWQLHRKTTLHQEILDSQAA